MSKIEIIKEDELELLKNNLHFYIKDFGSDTNEQLIDSIGHSPFIFSKFEMKDIELETSFTTHNNNEIKNVKLIYEELKYLTPSQASDERLWAGLCLTKFWKYTKARWNIDEKLELSNIKSHFFFGYGAKRSLTRNAISRLWWIGKLTYDQEADDPYELTKLVCRNSTYIQDALERNVSNNPEIILPFLKGIKKAEIDGFVLTKESFKRLAMYLNLLGGTYILDLIPNDVIEKKIYEYALKGQ